MPRVGLELTIAVFERAETVHDLDRAAILIDNQNFLLHYIRESVMKIVQINYILSVRRGLGQVLHLNVRKGPSHLNWKSVLRYTVSVSFEMLSHHTLRKNKNYKLKLPSYTHFTKFIQLIEI
jgi:hypothetical protein